MTDAFSKTMHIQIFLSIPLILFGVVAIYLIHRARSESALVTSYDPSDGSEAAEPEQAGSMLYTSSPDREDKLDKTQDMRHETRDRKSEVSSLKSQVSSPEFMVKRLEKLKYDGYMRVGDMKIAWLSDGEGRIAAEEGSALDGTIRIDEIYENFLLVSAADGHIVRKIPFTQKSDELGSKLPSSAAVTARSTHAGSANVVSTQSAPTTISTQAKARHSASESKLAAGSSDKAFPPSDLYARPPVPGQILPTVTQSGSHRNDYGTLIYADPASKTVKSVGETFMVQVKIDNGSNVFAVPFDINYDPNVLEVTGLYEGSYLKRDGGQTTFLNSMDRDRGKITVGLTRLGRIGGVSGSGTLMSIAFRALKSGTAFLSFANGKPMDSGLNVLPVKFVRGEVRVQ
jgi:hypothetical protein